MNKKALGERDICSKVITPAVLAARWDLQIQVREEVSFTKGQVIVRGKLVTRGKGKRADYVLSHKANLPLDLIEAKDNTFSVGAGMQQALEYAEALGTQFVFSSKHVNVADMRNALVGRVA
jgi:type I restriction enzyme R subunit